MYVCMSRGCAVHKRLKGSRSCSGGDSLRTRGTEYGGPDPPTADSMRPLPNYFGLLSFFLHIDNLEWNSALCVSVYSRKNAASSLCLRRLKIDEMMVHDSGTYTCVGFNQYGRQSTNGSVYVRQGEIRCIRVSLVTAKIIICH